MHHKKVLFLSIGSMLMLVCLSAWWMSIHFQAESDSPNRCTYPAGQVITPKTTDELRTFFNGVHYTAVPRVYITQLPDDFIANGSLILFEKVLAPLVLKENEILKCQRQHLWILKEKQDQGIKWTQSEQAFFELLVQKYDAFLVKTPVSQMNDLLNKVDEIPVALVVAQLAYETDWGKKNLNSPYGVYEWTDDKTYQRKEYPSLLDATVDFMHHLNTMGTLTQMRMIRRQLKKASDQTALSPRLVPLLRAFHPDETDYVPQMQEILKAPALLLLDWTRLKSPESSQISH